MHAHIAYGPPVRRNTTRTSTSYKTTRASKAYGVKHEPIVLHRKRFCLFFAFQELVASDDIKKYQPGLLEGRISRKRIALDRLYGSGQLEYHEGYLIQMVYNQPLFIHFDNKRESLNEVSAAVLNGFVSIKCDFPKGKVLLSL